MTEYLNIFYIENMLKISIVSLLCFSLFNKTNEYGLSKENEFYSICREALNCFPSLIGRNEFVIYECYKNNIDIDQLLRTNESDNLLEEIDLYFNTNFRDDYPTYTPFTIYTASNKTISGLLYDENLNHLPPPTSTIYNHPSAVYVSPESYYYNCHSFAWYFDGDINKIDSNTNLCFDHPNCFISSYPYCGSMILSKFTPSNHPNYASYIQSGDIILYYATSDDRATFSDAITHSAVVISESTSFNYLNCISKWGYHAVYTHLALDCNYYHGALNNFAETEIAVYRPNHTYAFSNPTALQHKCTSYCCGRVKYEPHHFVPYTSTTYICVDCNYISGNIFYSEGNENE